MASLLRIAIYSATFLFPLGSSSLHVPTALEYGHFTRHHVNQTQAQNELGAHLSSAATIFGPTDPEWANATERYDTYAPPKIQLVVIPGTESDIPEIVSCRFMSCGYLKAIEYANLCRSNYLIGQMVQFKQSAIYRQEPGTFIDEHGR